jgi:tetratricopeptide (TPR) repeat protein
MKGLRLVLVAIVALGSGRLGVPRVAAQENPTLDRWAQAVLRHEPGVADDALQMVWTLGSGEQRLISDDAIRLAEAMDAFLAGAIEYTGADPVLRLAQTLSARVSGRVFRERAAVLHADAVIFDRSGVLSPGPAVRGSKTFATAYDGEVTGLAPENWNWPFARRILDSEPPTDFVALWYHATAAYLFRNGLFGELGDHLAQAHRAMPHDARVLFDQGCLAEALGLDLVQQVAAHTRSQLPSAETTNAHAIEDYRHAIEADPHLAEARVRLARLLDLYGDHAGALQELHQALGDTPSRAVAFYAHLFAARAESAMGHLTDAQHDVDGALALFPHAASGLLAASQLALNRADATAALSRLHELSEPTPGVPDPWTDYAYGAGRDGLLTLTEMWRAVPPLAARRP